MKKRRKQREEPPLIGRRAILSPGAPRLDVLRLLPSEMEIFQKPPPFFSTDGSKISEPHWPCLFSFFRSSFFLAVQPLFRCRLIQMT
jgi:hypothetical protein